MTDYVKLYVGNKGLSWNYDFKFSVKYFIYTSTQNTKV